MFQIWLRIHLSSKTILGTSYLHTKPSHLTLRISLILGNLALYPLVTHDQPIL